MAEDSKGRSDDWCPVCITGNKMEEAPRCHYQFPLCIYHEKVTKNRPKLFYSARFDCGKEYIRQV